MERTLEDYREEERIINQGNPWGDNSPDDTELIYEEMMEEALN